MAFVL
ncbi:hypothetical protein D038_0705A, partial [Vibrio parahaemolyticus IDH02189]